MDVSRLPWFYPIPIITLCLCLGVLFAGFLVITYAFLVEKKGLYGAISLLSLLGLSFIGNELGVVLCSFAGLASLGMAFHRAEALSAAVFIFALPFYLHFLLEATPGLRRATLWIARSSFVFVAAVFIAAFADPPLFLDLSQKAGPTQPWSLGRGTPGPLYAIRDLLIAAMGLYSIFTMIVELRLYRSKRHIIQTTLGTSMGILSGVADVILARIESKTGLFSIRTFSFFGVGLTSFVVSSMISVLNWYIDQTKTIGRAQKLEALSLLAGGIAHDFNNILCGILGNSALLKDSVDAPGAAAIAEIEKAVLRARALSAQMITYARGGIQKRKALDLAKLVREIAEASLADSRVTLDFESAKGLWMAWADPIQVGQVVQNIVLNAKEAMRGRGKLRVSLENYYHRAVLSSKPTGRYVAIRFHDTGPGISKENERKIFDPYFSTKDSGTGLGLSVCWAILESHGGSIELAPKEEKGAAFLINLPAV